jgi:hypothetical protein
MKESISIGTASAKAGTKSNGFVKVASRPDGSDVKIPIMIVNGASDGALVLADAGVHGDEYEGMEAIRRTANALDPKKMKGAFIGIPCLNVLAFEAGKRFSVIDYLNLNRICPGKPVGKGYITENIAYVYEHDIVKPLKEIVTCCVSFHGGGDIQQCGPHLPYGESPGPVGEKSSEYSRVFGCELLSTAVGGYPPAGTGGTTTILRNLGIPSVSAEVGGEARCYDEYVNVDIRGLNNLMKYFKIIDGKMELPEKWYWVEGPLLNCTKGGFFINHVKKTGEWLHKGDLIGRTVNYFGEELERAEAPDDGVVFMLRTLPTVWPGDWYCGFGKVKKVYTRSELKLG